MSDTASKPLIGVPACIRVIDRHPFHSVQDKYVRAVADAADGLPLVIPALGDRADPARLIEALDGLMLTGSPSNVHPSHYGRPANPKAEPHDTERDATTLPLIRMAVQAGLPLFAICRGMQELNVALGGTLHARVHELPGRMDHRRPRDVDMDVEYGPRHPVALTPGGRLEAILGPGRVEVNSLHGQGVDAPGPGLMVEAIADDGTIEGLGLPNAPGFVLGVQWHPEYKPLGNPISRKLFAAFAAAVRAHAAARACPPADIVRTLM